MLILTLDSALERVSVGLVDGDRVLVADVRDMARGIALLPGMARTVLAQAERLDAIGVTVGPGGFTGIRGALALAHGIGLGAGIPVVAVSVPEALAAAHPAPPGRTLWIAIDNRRGGVFLARGGEFSAISLESLPSAHGPLALGGDAALLVAARLGNADVTVIPATLPEPAGIAKAARGRLAGNLVPLAAQPLYVDPPAIGTPAAPPRLAPVG